MALWNPNTPSAGATPAEVETSAEAAITTATSPGGSIYNLVYPDTFGQTQTFTGSTAYEVFAGSPGPGKICVTYLLLHSDKDIEWSLWSGNTFTILGPISGGLILPANFPLSITAGTLHTWVPNQGEAINLRVDDATASVQCTAFAIVVQN